MCKIVTFNRRIVDSSHVFSELVKIMLCYFDYTYIIYMCNTSTPSLSFNGDLSSVSNGYCRDYSCCFTHILSVINVILIRLKIILKSLRRFTSPITDKYYKFDDVWPVLDISLFMRENITQDRFDFRALCARQIVRFSWKIIFLSLSLSLFFLTRCRCIFINKLCNTTLCGKYFYICIYNIYSMKTSQKRPTS